MAKRSFIRTLNNPGVTVAHMCRLNSSVVADLILGPYDFTFLLILQLSCVLHMVPFWETRSKLRVMQIVETDGMHYKVLGSCTLCGQIWYPCCR